MQDRALIAQNLVNGVDPVPLAQSLHIDETEVTQAFNDAMHLVAEYVLVHCVPHFPCLALAEARRNQARVCEVIEAITLWDELERDMMLDLLKGKNVMEKYGAGRPVVEALLNRTLNAVPHYLTANEAAQFGRDRKGFLVAHRSRVIEAVERFVSFKNPLVYKTIEHLGIEQEAA
jgi:hypothetical protein